MSVHFSVFVAALLAFSEAKPVIQVPVPSDLIHNSSNVFDDDVSKHLPFYHRPTSSLPTLQPRQHVITSLPDPATDDVWDRYVRKGHHLMTQMVYSDYDAAQLLPGPHRNSAQSPYGFGTLERWGYKTYEVSNEYCDFGTGPEKLWGISPYLQSRKISYKCKEDKGQWRAAVIKHWDVKKEKVTPLEIQTYRGPDGITRRSTGAFFHIAVTPEGGIMAQNRLSPWVSLKYWHDDASPTELPKMQRSSDMMWSLWEYFIPKDLIPEIKFFITVAIRNPTTLSLVRRVLEARGEDLKPEGVKISMGTSAGRALLSSPNGAGFAHFLIERKAQIGLKIIDSVILMQCEDQDHSACMVFNVQSISRPEALPKDDGRPKDR